MLIRKRQNKWIGLLFILLILLGTVGCSRVDPGTETGESAGENIGTEETVDTQMTESDETQPDVPEEWHVFEYNGVKYDFWDISELVNGVSEWGQIGKYIIAEGHVNPNMCIYAVIDPETKTMVRHFEGTVPAYHGDDINTLVYAYMTNVVAYDGTTLAAYGLQNGEYIDSLSYTEDKSCIEVAIEGRQGSRTEIINLYPFDAEAYFAHIPAEWSQRLFWHQIRGSSDYMYFCNYRGANSTLDGYNPNPPKQFFVFHVNSKNQNIIGNIQAEIPSDITYDTVCPVVVMDGAGSMECEFIVQLTDDDKRFYVSFDNFDWGEAQSHLTFTCRGVLSEEHVDELKALYPEAFLKAEQYFWNYTLEDFKNENHGSGLVYEGYTVEYDIPHPDYTDQTFPVHIHLPQVNDDSVYADKWNWFIKDKYGTQYNDLLNYTAYGTNNRRYASVTYETVTTGDVITIYIIDAGGFLNSGAAGRAYDIYQYDTVQKKFLSTDEFLAYYAEGQFAAYTVADIVKFMNEHVYTTDELGNPYPLTEENILGVIPSVFGDGKFDVVYQGYVVEGRFASRMLFSPYPVYNHQYTYRLTYHDYVDCEDKEIYGTPAGYRLLINQRVIGEYDTGYYVDCLFVEDIAEPPESYSLSEHGGYYTPVQEDPYGNMYIVVDHETDRWHLNAWIPFDMPDTAQDYYWGIHNRYFSYDRILDGANYQVNQNIAEMVTQVLDAYRNGKDPNELLPASATEYTPYPMETIRENPTADEIGEILKNTSVGESGIINFGIDLGDGWRMALPIGIGGFGDGAQAYFTGIYFAHGTTKKDTITLPENFVFPITDGSTSTTNLDKAVKSAILGGEQTVVHTKTYTSFHNLLDGKCDLIFTTPLSDSQLQNMQNVGFRHEAEPVAGEGFVFVVNKDNPVDTLTVEQIKGIYSGEITNWKDVGGNDAQIIAYQRNADSGSQNYMISFMGDTPLMQPITEQTPASMSGILDVIAGYDNGIDAIGYSVYAYSDGMYENISEIKYIKVNGVEPSLTTLADGTYPLLGYNYAVFSADEPEDSNVRALVKWIQSDEGQQVIADAGYIPYRRVEGLTLPEATTKTLYTAVGTSGVMKPDEASDYYYQCNSVPKSFVAQGLNEAVAAFIANAEEELSHHDAEEIKNFVKSRFPWGFVYDIKTSKTLINGYLSVVVGIRYNEGAQDSPDYYYDVRAAVFDIYTGKQLELSDLFFDGEDFVPLLNQYLADKAVSPYSTFGATHDMLSSFTGLYEGEFTFTADSIIFNRNTCFADGVVLSLDGLLEYMATSVPRDMAGYVDASVPVYKKIRYMAASEYAEVKNGITIWYLEKENNLLSEEVCDRVNTFIDSVYNEYFTPEKLLASAQKIDSAYDRVTIGPFPDFHVNLYGKRFIEVRGANLAFPLKMGEESYGIDYTVVQGHYNSFYFAYYFNALTGEELRMGDLFIDGWENKATYSVYDEDYEQWIAYTKTVDVSTCRILSISDYVNTPYNKGDMSDLEIPVTVYVSTENGDRIAVSVPREYILN